ncbi:protein lava lamp-like [Malaya genurostris]|uniref:protein lava lamp-like n=1 Tax=Malaya genurostris TaxID=325434 RepID=UPI0026F3D7E5|nr:protein lava lamp-like [Malaya genurostris]
MSAPDPEGGPPPAVGDHASGRTTPDLNTLQENFSQQQAKITALRELVRQTETAHVKKTASAQEKVKNIAQRLTQYKTKATKSRLSRASSSEVHPDLIATRINEEGADGSFDSYQTIDYEEQQHMSLPVMPFVGGPSQLTRARSETPGSEKFNLLRQQMEQNRLKMAERESHKREMEERVSELKHKLETTQQTLERSVEYGRSTGDLTLITPMKISRLEFNKSTSDLTQLADYGYGASNFDVERLRYLEGRVKVLEQQLANKDSIFAKDEQVGILERKILDLEEALKEKECIIEARTQAVSLMTENLTLKGKNTVDLLEDTKQEMYRMQTNFVQAESNLKGELDRLQVELDERNSKISNLEEMNNILETARFDLTVENSSLKQKLEDVQDFSTKISELNKLNQSLQHRITELENQKYDFITDAEAEQAKFGESDEKYRELLDRIHELEEELSKKSAPEDDLLEKIRSSEATIAAQAQQIESLQQQQAELQECLQEKTVELNVLNANFSVLQEKLKTAGPKPLFPKSAEEEAEVENSKLKQQLDEANKSAIKSKLKIKQLQKQVDSFKKTSSVHEEVVRLTNEVQSLTQRLAEVEEEKGNLQLHLVNYDGSLPGSELEKRIKILEATCQNQTTAIQLLEEQKIDMSDDLNSTRQQLETVRGQVREQQRSDDEHTGRISCQISSIEIEEKLEQCVADREEMTAQLKRLEAEKLDLQQRLDRYMVENIELLDKIEKLSLEKVSSAESIEIVEGLTPKEKQEIESYEASRAIGDPDGGTDEVDRSKRRHDGETAQELRAGDDGGEGAEEEEEGEDLNDSLVKLREESSELMHRIELFTNERREVLGKLEAVTIENQAHLDELEQLREEHRLLTDRHRELMASEADLRQKMTELLNEKTALVEELREAKQLKVKLEVEASESSSSQSSPARIPIDRSLFEQALRSVDNEVSNYNKNKDKNKKLQISKKLSQDAKNLQKMANGLLDEYCKSVEDCEEMRGEIEQLKQKLCHLLPEAKEQPEFEEVAALKAQIMDITRAQIDKVEQIDELRDEIDRKNELISQLKHEMEILRDAEKSSDEEPELLKVELNSRNDEIRELKKELDTLAVKKTCEVEDLQSRLGAASKEIDILKELVAEQKQQLIDSYQEHENELAGKMKEIHNYENRVKQMQEEIDRMIQHANQDAERYSDNLKEQLAELNSLVTQQKNEADLKQETIDTLNGQIVELYKTMEDNATRIIEKEDEVQFLQELLDAKNDEIQMLQTKLTTNQTSLDAVHKQLQEALAVPIPPAIDVSRLEELEASNRELDGKNKDLMEKLRKFAANLKKKHAQCQELEDKLTVNQQELEELRSSAASSASAMSSEEELKSENEELAQKLHHLNNELHKLLQQKYTLESEKQSIAHELTAQVERASVAEQKLQSVEGKLAQMGEELGTLQEDVGSKHVKIEKCKAIIKEKIKEIQRLQEYERKTAYLEDELRMSQSKLEDFHNQTLLIGKLKTDKEEMNGVLRAESDRNKSLEREAIDTSEKIRKLEIDLELTDEENRKLRGQIAKLEEGLSLVEQRRNSLERQKKLLGEELTEKSQEFSQHEDELMQRLVNLSQHDEVVEAKLREREEELVDLGGKLREVEHQRDQLQRKTEQLEIQMVAHEQASQRSSELENENYNLNLTLTSLQVDLKRAVSDLEVKLTEKDTEIDQLEVELTNQLAKIENERKQLQENLERSHDKNTDLQDELVRLQESVNSLEQFRSDLEKEVTWLKMQNESLQQDSSELQELRMQIVQDQTELENLRAQNETLAQNHQCEINALRQQIADMEAIRTQLSQNQTDDQVFVQNEIIKLKDLLEQKEAEIGKLVQANLQLQMSAASGGVSAIRDPFRNLQESSERSAIAMEEKIRELENDAVWKDSRIQELQIEKDLAEGSVDELRKQLHLLQARIERDEVVEAQLAEKSSQLEAMSKQLFGTVSQPQHIASTAHLFASPSQSGSASLFDAVGDWTEPFAMQQSTKPNVDDDDENRLREEIIQLKTQNETATREIEQLRAQLNAFIDRDDELHQLKDEIDILRAQNASLSYELEVKSSKLKDVSQQLQSDQMKVDQLEEQIKRQQAPAVVSSVASFFTDTDDSSSALNPPVFEDIIVPKRTYLCTPSQSQDHEMIAEPVVASSNISLQAAVPTTTADGTLELSAQNQQLKLQLDLQSATVEQLEQELNSVRQQSASLQQQLDEIRQQKRTMEERESQQQELLNNLRTEHQQQLAVIQAEKQTELDLLRIQSQKNQTELRESDESYRLLVDELEISRINNASLLAEVQEKSDKIQRFRHTLTEAETKIVQLEEQLAVAAEEKPRQVASSLFGSSEQPREPVFEEIVQSKRAFVMQPPPPATVDIDEDCCWGTEEAMLEAKHQQVSEKDDYIRQLELEKERLQQEIIELKVKSGKLLKKTKEYKMKCDSLERRSASVETSELDLAIQEELNGRIKTLETKLGEMQVEREKMLTEKDSLVKRNDMLVAASERFTEMKDRQDVQLEMQQAKIRELNAKVQRLEDWDETSEQRVVKQPLESASAGEDTGQLKAQLDELTGELNDLKVDNEELQALLDEEKANVAILEKRVQQKDSEIQTLMDQIDGLSQDSRTIKSSLESLNQQKSQETVDLSQRLNELMSKNTDLTHQIEKMRTESMFHSSEQEAQLQQQLQQLSAQLQYKEAEIVHLNERIQQQALEDQTESLVQEILGKNQEITALKSRIQQLDGERQELEHNLTLQISQELASTRPEDKQCVRLAELERANKDLLDERKQMEQELEILNDQVIRSLEFEDRMKSTVLDLDAKNIEIQALKASLEQMKQTNAAGAGQNTPEKVQTDVDVDVDLRKQIETLSRERADLEANYRITLEQRDAHWAEVVDERGSQVAESWKQHVDMREAEFSIVEKSLREEIQRLQEGKPATTTTEEEEDSQMVQKMKQALESQEVEIVTLKEQLAIRSAEYARLAAQVDPFAVKHAASMVTSEPRSQPTDDDKVPRSELELALYMIYQRDMRCDELELELRNLLEERDALQLRLSNALRQQEEFKRKLVVTHPDEASGDSSDISKTTTPEKTLQQIVQESGISGGTVPSDATELSNKLSELHSIGHAKDKRLQEERDQRYRQLTLIQRDLANMPLEAAAKIAGTSISQTSESSPQQQNQQSASSVLINWILGKKSDS